MDIYLLTLHHVILTIILYQNTFPYGKPSNLSWQYILIQCSYRHVHFSIIHGLRLRVRPASVVHESLVTRLFPQQTPAPSAEKTKTPHVLR